MTKKNNAVTNNQDAIIAALQEQIRLQSLLIEELTKSFSATPATVAAPAPAVVPNPGSIAAREMASAPKKRTNKKVSAPVAVLTPAAPAPVKSKLQVAVEDALKHRGCKCQPMIDTKIIPLWNKEGYVIKKGETALATYKKFYNGKVQVNGVFCRCQVEIAPEKKSK